MITEGLLTREEPYKEDRIRGATQDTIRLTDYVSSSCWCMLGCFGLHEAGLAVDISVWFRLWFTVFWGCYSNAFLPSLLSLSFFFSPLLIIAIASFEQLSLIPSFFCVLGAYLLESGTETRWSVSLGHVGTQCSADLRCGVSSCQRQSRGVE